MAQLGVGALEDYLGETRDVREPEPGSPERAPRAPRSAIMRYTSRSRSTLVNEDALSNPNSPETQHILKTHEKLLSIHKCTGQFDTFAIRVASRVPKANPGFSFRSSASRLRPIGHEDNRLAVRGAGIAGGRCSACTPGPPRRFRRGRAPRRRRR